MRQTHTFVLKILLDRDAAPPLRGQISEPSSDDEWRVTFGDAAEMLAVLRRRLGLAQQEAQRAALQGVTEQPSVQEKGNGCLENAEQNSKMQNQQLSPQDYEREALPPLVEQIKRYDARVKQFLAQAQTRRLASIELDAFGQELAQWENYLRQFEPPAQMLAQANLPTMRQWLEWALDDMPDLRRIIERWEQQAAVAEGQFDATLRSADQEILGIMNSVNASRQATFERVNQQWNNYLKR